MLFSTGTSTPCFILTQDPRQENDLSIVNVF